MALTIKLLLSSLATSQVRKVDPVPASSLKVHSSTALHSGRSGMFIVLTHNARTNSVRRSGIQLELHHSESFRSSERSRRGSSSESYKHITPNWGETHCLRHLHFQAVWNA